MNGTDAPRTREGGALAIAHAGHDDGRWRLDWLCEKWEQDKIEHVLSRIDGEMIPHELGGRTIYRPRADGLPSAFLREYGIEPDEITVVEGNLLVNEGIQRLLDLLIGVAGNPYNNAGSFIGVGDSAAAEAASQVELQAAANRFYKAMVAAFPARPGSNGAQSVDWRSDFTTTEANWVWNEWTIAAGATTASGAGFTNGTTNLNRKVQSLGTKSTGTWTMTGTVTIS